MSEIETLNMNLKLNFTFLQARVIHICIQFVDEHPRSKCSNVLDFTVSMLCR